MSNTEFSTISLTPPLSVLPTDDPAHTANGESTQPTYSSMYGTSDILVDFHDVEEIEQLEPLLPSPRTISISNEGIQYWHCLREMKTSNHL